MERRIDEAIAHCRTAIALDPDFGNPYNAIGAHDIEPGHAGAREQIRELHRRLAMVN